MKGVRSTFPSSREAISFAALIGCERVAFALSICIYKGYSTRWANKFEILGAKALESIKEERRISVH